MTLKEFKQHIESFPPNTVFSYGIEGPFSWRGSYAEVAFAMSDKGMTREEILERINEAYSREFAGYKGGEYRYGDHTDVHFENDYGSYTDGGYCAKWIAGIEKKPAYIDNEMRLINLAFTI